MSVLGFIGDIADLALAGVTIAEMKGNQEHSKESTIVQMVVGHGEETMVGCIYISNS